MSKEIVKKKQGGGRGGRKSAYNKTIAVKICAYIAAGDSVRRLSKRDGMPDAATIFRWLAKYEEFREQYARACEERANYQLEEILDIADDGSNDWMEVEYGDETAWKINGEAVQRSRLRIDTRKWAMSKMLPKKYGDRLTLDPESGLNVKHEFADVPDDKLVAMVADLVKGADDEAD
jgi:hypothetical protein